MGDAQLVMNERVGLEHSRQTLAGVAGLLPGMGELLEMLGDLPVMPRGEDRFDVGEVLVQRRPSDPRLLGDLRHRHRRQPVLRHQRCRRVQRGVAHRSAVRLDRVVPELRHRFDYTFCFFGDTLI